MFRAIRFCCQLNFSLDKNTKLAIIKNSEISNVNGEIIRNEFKKSLLGINPKMIMEFFSTNLIKYIFPETFKKYLININSSDISYCKKTLEVLSDKPKELTCRFSTLIIVLLKTFTNNSSNTNENNDFINTMLDDFKIKRNRQKILSEIELEIKNHK